MTGGGGGLRVGEARSNVFFIIYRSEDRIYFSFLLKSASAAMGAWKCSFPLFYEIMTGRPINQQQRADMRCPRKVTLPIKDIKN